MKPEVSAPKAEGKGRAETDTARTAKKGSNMRQRIGGGEIELPARA
jgi:hypothetical protein